MAITNNVRQVARDFGDVALSNRLRDGVVSYVDLHAAENIYGRAVQQMNSYPTYGAQQQLEQAQYLYNEVANTLRSQPQEVSNAETRKDRGYPAQPEVWGQGQARTWGSNQPAVRQDMSQREVVQAAVGIALGAVILEALLK